MRPPGWWYLKKRKRELDLGPRLSGPRSRSPTVRVSWVAVLVQDLVKRNGVGPMSRVFLGTVLPVRFVR
jgi:hypothetical protein